VSADNREVGKGSHGSENHAAVGVRRISPRSLKTLSKRRAGRMGDQAVNQISPPRESRHNLRETFCTPAESNNTLSINWQDATGSQREAEQKVFTGIFRGHS